MFDIFYFLKNYVLLLFLEMFYIFLVFSNFIFFKIIFILFLFLKMKKFATGNI